MPVPVRLRQILEHCGEARLVLKARPAPRRHLRLAAGSAPRMNRRRAAPIGPLLRRDADDSGALHRCGCCARRRLGMPYNYTKNLAVVAWYCMLDGCASHRASFAARRVGAGIYVEVLALPLWLK
jgi:hypothetical protein